MKKIAVILLLAAAAAGIALACGGSGQGESVQANAYLRIHIRANSNAQDDQALKYEVRDGVVEYLAPALAACTSKEQAIAAVTARLSALEGVAQNILRGNGCTYGVRARVCEEPFPTRVYEDVTLPAGVYDALILELGAGEGDNWWCVVYPPLCFTGGNVRAEYRSRLAELVRAFFGA